MNSHIIWWTILGLSFVVMGVVQDFRSKDHILPGLSIIAGLLCFILAYLSALVGR